MILSVISTSLYAQYPVVKKIGNDTVVVMTLKQGKEVNNKFELMQDSILYYKKSVDSLNLNLEEHRIYSGKRLQKMYESYWSEYEKSKFYKKESDSFRHMYMANKLIYLENEKNLKRDVRHATIYATVLTFMVMLFSAL